MNAPILLSTPGFRNKQGSNPSTRSVHLALMPLLLAKTRLGVLASPSSFLHGSFMTERIFQCNFVHKKFISNYTLAYQMRLTMHKKERLKKYACGKNVRACNPDKKLSAEKTPSVEHKPREKMQWKIMESIRSLQNNFITKYIKVSLQLF